MNPRMHASIYVTVALLATAAPVADAQPQNAATSKQSSSQTSTQTGLLPSFTAQGKNLIRLQVGAFDPLQTQPKVNPKIPLVNDESIPNGHPTYWLVQVKDNRFAEVAKAIQQTGAERVGNVPDAVYMVRATREQRLALASHPAVRWTGLYQPAWRVPAKANGKPGLLDLKGTQNYQVHLFRSHPDPSAVARAIKPPAKVTSTGTVLAVQASAEQVPAIAALDGVEWVTVKPTVVLLNENARWVLDTGERDIFAATRQDRLTGKGQTAAVADTGVNYKPDVNGRAHVAFRDCTPVCEEADYTQETAGTDTDLLTTIVQHNPAGSHRKMAAFFDLGGVGPNPPDESSHGTHVAGSVNGDAGRLGAHDGHDGIAPAARLVMQSIADSGGGLNTPGDYYQLFRQAYRPRSPASVPEEYNPADYANYRANEDARTHNNSYGLTVPIADIGQAIAIDQFVWDHEDMSIVVSAGNSGPDVFSTQAPAVSKNGFSSAASSNGRQPMVSIDALTNFSSHGPTGDGRFGPTVATPGEIVVGPKGGTVDANHYLQGTSMSGPVLTGAVTLVRQYFWDGYGPAGGQGFPAGAPSTARRHNPSAALVKAAVVDGATRMRGYYTGDEGRERAFDGQWPSAGQGFGLVNLDNSLYFSGDPLNNWYHDVYRSDDDAFDIGNGGSRSYEIDVDAGKPLDVTLAWSDAPDLLPAGTPNLVNNLDLVVTGPENQTYVGNNMNTRTDPGAETGATINDAAAAPDAVNNIERVSVPNAQAGRYTVTVLAPVIADGPQGFALTAKGGVKPQGSTFRPGPGRQADAPGSPTISNLAVEPVSADLARVTFTTSEPTTAHVTVSGINNQFADVYTLTEAGYHGIETSPVETSPNYSGKRVLGTRHEVLVTGLSPGVSYVPTAHVTDLARRTASLRGTSFRAPATTFQPGAPDIGQLSSEEFTDLGPASRPVAGDQWEIGKQLYAGNDGSNQLLGAFMFRLPPSVNPAAITGAHIEFSSAHILSSVYTADPVFSVDLLDSSVEPEWGTQIYQEIADAPATARLNPASTMRRGANERIDYAFSCNELGALKATLTEQTGGTRNAAFRYVSTEEDEVSLVSMEFGFNRRSHGAQLRPKLVLETSNPPSVPPFTRCNPATPAPTISDVGIHPGLTPDAMGVSWRTNVDANTVVLFRQKGTSAWTQVASNALTKLHQIEVRGLDPSKHYEFGVRSVACNGATRTADNSGRGWDFFFSLGAPVATHPYDFEASAQGWTTTSEDLGGDVPSTGTEWERRSPGHQSQQAWYAMPYGDHYDANLISPQLALPGTVTAVRFYAAYDFEVPPPGGVFSTSDGLYVDFSTDGGASWANVGILQGQNASFPEFDLHQVTFSTPPGPIRVRLRMSSDDNISTPPFQGAKADTVTVLSYSPISSGQQPSAGPYPPPSAGASGLNLAAVRPSGAPTALERASGTGVCVAASSRGRITPVPPPPGPSGPGLPATGGLESTVIGAGLLALLAAAMIRRRRLHRP